MQFHLLRLTNNGDDRGAERAPGITQGSGRIDLAPFDDLELVTHHSRGIEHPDRHGVALEIHQHRADFHDGHPVDRRESEAPGTLSIPCHYRHGSLMGVLMGTLPVGSVALRVAIPIVEDDTVRGGGGAVGAIEKHRTFIDVRMAGKHEVDPVVLQDGQHDLAHLDELVLDVAVVGSLGVGRVMPEGDQPLGIVPGEVPEQPVGHRADPAPFLVVAIEADEMNGAEIERIV